MPDELTASWPENYPEVLRALTARVQDTRVRALLAVNAELVQLYLEIGHQLATSGGAWGQRVVRKLADDLRRSFPDMRGFSRTNLYNMRKVWLAWSEAEEDIQSLITQLPWGHHVTLTSKVDDPGARVFYLRRTITEGWSRAVLTLNIERGLHEREGKALSNFASTLPAADSDLVEQTFKDPYLFDFLGTGELRRERELERALLAHVQSFLMELGSGFALVGHQVPLEVGGRDFYIDLLFYHLRLRCFVVIELKAVPFEPAFAGQLNFYLSAVDDLMRHPTDNPTIGLLLVKDPEKNTVMVEYALRGLERPIGVASWETELVRQLPDDLKGSLPTVEELELELVGEE